MQLKNIFIRRYKSSRLVFHPPILLAGRSVNNATELAVYNCMYVIYNCARLANREYIGGKNVIGRNDESEIDQMARVISLCRYSASVAIFFLPLTELRNRKGDQETRGNFIRIGFC